MKIAVKCESLLLQKALEKFLKNHLSHEEEAKLILIDDLKNRCEKPYLLIGNDDQANIKKPFSKSTLFLAIEKYFSRQQEIKKIKSTLHQIDKPQPTSKNKRKIYQKEAEEQIINLTKQYAANIIKVIRRMGD